MKTANLEPDGRRAANAAGGRVSTNKAAGTIHLRDAAGTDITVDELVLLGLRLYEDDDDIGIINAEFGNLSLDLVSPAQLTANTDNWDPDPADTGATIIRTSTDASRNLTGILAPVPVDEVLRILVNVGSFDVVLKHDVTSTAANRFYTPLSIDVTISPGATAILFYDTTSSRWRVMSVTPVGGSSGTWVTYTPSWTSDGTQPAIGNGTLTGNYKVLDSTTITVTIRFVRGSTSTNGTGTYFFSLPSGYSSTLQGAVGSARLLDSGTAHYSATGVVDGGGTAVHTVVADAAGVRLFANTIPFTLATNDELNIQIVMRYA